MKSPGHKLTFLRELIAPRSYFGLLISLFLLALLSAGTGDSQFTRAAVIILTFSLVMSIGVAVSRSKHTAYPMFIGGFLVSLMILFSSFFQITGTHTKFLQMASYVMGIIYVAYAALIILQDVFSGRVNANRICGAICFYLMIGMCFGLFFFTLDMHDGTAFKVDHFYDGTPKAGLPISLHDRYTLFNYMSFCTLSTLGFGDMTPVSQVARTCTWIEAIFGQLYLSILVARLVGLHIAGMGVETTREEGPPLA